MLLLVVPLVAAIFYSFNRMEQSAHIDSAPNVELPRYTLHTATMTRFDATGAISMIGRASTVEYFDDRSGHATTVDVDLIQGDSKVWNVKSPTAFMPPNERRFYMENQVTAVGAWPDIPEMMTIDSHQVWIDPATHIFSGQMPVFLHSPSRNGTGIGFSANWLDHSLELQSAVRMVYDAHR